MEAMTIRQLSEETGYPQEVFRQGCARDSRHHPLPHIRSGAKRPRIYIDREVADKWLEEEMTV